MERKKVDKPNFYIDPSRIQDLTDGIFAFSMTLLIVSVSMPDSANKISENALSSQLTGMVPTFLTFILSFILIATFWVVHHKQFQSIKKSDDTLIWINIILMLLVVFMPFTTDLADDYGYLKIAILVFNLNMFLIGVMFYIQYAYSASHGLMDERISQEHIAHYKKQNSIIAIVSLSALIVGLFLPKHCTYLYILIPVLILYVKKTKKLREDN